MSWSSRLPPVAALVVLLSALLPLAACTVRPVYGEHGVTQGRLEVGYSEPRSRLDQVVIADLKLRLGSSQDPSAPLVSISTQPSSRTLTRTDTTKARTEQITTVTVSFTLAANGQVVAIGSRSASAQWQTTGQVLADEAAARDAEERAARAAGESVRLSILAALARPAATQ